jgi:NDP-sugar pyrophosphorylase family protein
MEEYHMQAVVLAGGVGSRLKPFTTSIPKPLVPVGDRPILEIVLLQLKQAGFRKVILAVNHLAELIMAFFGNGEKLGIEISYSVEDKPLGTAGPLALLDGLEDDFLVMNGDLLTTLDYGRFFENHRSAGNDVTIATYKKEIKIDLGVLSVGEDDRFEEYIEKPTYHFEVSTGIYALRRSTVAAIPTNRRFDMPEFVTALHKKDSRIRCYREEFYWLDIGRVDDYEAADQAFRDRRSEFLRDQL